jgi:acetate kinase
LGLALLRLRVLVLNAGSSSLKVSLLSERDVVVAEHDFESTNGRIDVAALKSSLGKITDVGAVGHRVVHGGRRFPGSVRIDAGVVRYLRTIADLAPLHLPASLAGIAAVSRLLPGTPAVACFDTAFHSNMPAAASTYAIPAAWRERFGIRRYGFHGFSHAYASRRTAELLDRPEAKLRVVTCHLGAGASLAAVSGGRSVDTTMGFTPLEGLVMATRSGTVDPGVALWVQKHARLTGAKVMDTLDRRSGLLALAGTGDMREVLKAVRSGNEDARLAFDVYVHRLRSLIASMVASIGGADAIAFTGGVGENSPAVRAAAASGLGFLGVEIDKTLNRKVATGADADISHAGAKLRTVVIHAREDVEVAREARRVLSPPSR